MNSKSSEIIINDVLGDTRGNSRLVILEGWSGSGKTTLCGQLLEHARLRKMTVGGIISPAVFEDGQKTGIDLVNVWNSETRRLGVRWKKIPGWVEVGTWWFDPRVLAWGNDLLANLPDCQAVFIDEIGPLEFENHSGFTSACKLIDSNIWKLIILSLRPSLVPVAVERWNRSYTLNLYDVSNGIMLSKRS